MSTIKSKEDLAYTVLADDLFPLVNYAGTIPKSVTPKQIALASSAVVTDRAMRQKAANDAMIIRDNSGVAKGVQPGVSPGTITGYVGTPSAPTPNAQITINVEADISGHADSTGTGTLGDPYVLDLLTFPSWQATTYAIDWNDPDADYYIKLTNCFFHNSDTAGIRVNILPATDVTRTKLFIENCTFRTDTLNGQSGAAPSVLIESGEVESLNCKCDRLRAPVFKIYTGTAFSGGNCKVSITNFLADDAVNGWGATSKLFANWSEGGICVMKGITHNVAWGFVNVQEDCELYVDRLMWNPEKRTDVALFMNWSTTAAYAAQRLPKVFTNCRIQAGNASIIKNSTAVTTPTPVQNVVFEHCEFLGPDLGVKNNNYRLLDIGNPFNDLSFADSPIYRFTNCLFTSPDKTFFLPGNEVVMLLGCRDTIIEGCWTIGGYEDCYEMHTSWGGNVVRHSGGTDVNGQLVDLYNEPGSTLNISSWDSTPDGGPVQFSFATDHGLSAGQSVNLHNVTVTTGNDPRGYHVVKEAIDTNTITIDFDPGSSASFSGGAVTRGEQGFHIHHIYGDCGLQADYSPGGAGYGEAVSITGVSNVLVHDIYVDNTAGEAEGTLSSIRISNDVTPSGTINVPDNITIHGPLPLNASCAGGSQYRLVDESGGGFGPNINIEYVDENGVQQSFGSPDILPIR